MMIFWFLIFVPLAAGRGTTASATVALLWLISSEFRRALDDESGSYLEAIYALGE